MSQAGAAFSGPQLRLGPSCKLSPRCGRPEVPTFLLAVVGAVALSGSRGHPLFPARGPVYTVSVPPIRAGQM